MRAEASPWGAAQKSKSAGHEVSSRSAWLTAGVARIHSARSSPVVSADSVIARQSRLQPPIEPGEGLLLHLGIELVGTGVEVAGITIARAGLVVQIPHHPIRPLHLGEREERGFVVVEHHGGLRDAQP